MAHRDLTRLFLNIRSPPSLHAIPSPSIHKPLLSPSRPLLTFSPPSWTRHADDANAAMRMIVIQLQLLQTLHTKRLMIRFDESECQFESQVELATNEIMALFSQADIAMHRITKEGGNAAMDVLVRLNTQRSIAQRLQELSSDFRRSQYAYLHRLELQKELMMDGNVQTLMRSRDGEIERIVHSIAGLARLFHEFAQLVIDQGSIVDRIDYNVGQALSHVQGGNEQLGLAEKQQKFARSEKCIAVLLALNVLCFFLLVLKHQIKMY